MTLGKGSTPAQRHDEYPFLTILVVAYPHGGYREAPHYARLLKPL